MSTQEARERPGLLQGTLDLLILAARVLSSRRRQGIARAILQWSGEELAREHGALCPRLVRREERTGIFAKSEASSTRQARFYLLTSAGRKQLVKHTRKWKRLATATGRILCDEAEG